MIYIYRADGQLLFKTVIGQECEHEEELMKSDLVRLKWNDVERLVLPSGCYITPFPDKRDPDGKVVRYTLFRMYIPEQARLGEYTYAPEFQHPKMRLAYIPFLFDTKDAAGYDIKKSDYDYIGSIGSLVTYICNYINRSLGLAVPFTVSLSELSASDTVSVTFAEDSILSAIQRIADTLECEFHLDWEKRKFYFGSVYIGEACTLKIGENIGVPKIGDSSNRTYNRYYVQGGSRNNTRETESGYIAVNTRLTLDESKYPGSIIDVRTSSAEPELTGIMTLDDIYPKLDLYLYDLHERHKYKVDGDVVTDEPWSVWYCKLAYRQGGRWNDYVVTGNEVIDLVPSLAFCINEAAGALPSSLGTREFEVIYHTAPVEFNLDDDVPGQTGIGAGYYEIVHKTEGSDELVVPTTSMDGAGIIPRGHDTPNIVNNKSSMFNIAISDEYKVVAQEALEERALKEIAKSMVDTNTYTFSSDVVVFEDGAPDLYIGRKVLFDDAAGYRITSRVQKLVTKLDYDFEQEITVGNMVLKEKVDEMMRRLENLEGISPYRERHTIEYQKQYLMVFCDQRGYPYNSVIPAHPGYVNIPLFPKIYYGEDDITATATAWQWRKYLPDGSEDTGWSAQHTERDITLTDLDMPTAWGRVNSVVFECIATLDADTEIAKTINFG